MGADLISYMVFGPAKLSTSAALLRKAEKRVKEFVEMAVKWNELADENPMTPEIESQIQALDTKPFEEPYDVAWATDYRDNPARIIEELFYVWSGAGRDLTYRRDPKNFKRSVYMAGELSWGDEPSGFAYQTFKHADQAGLFDIYGIE